MKKLILIFAVSFLFGSLSQVYAQTYKMAIVGTKKESQVYRIAVGLANALGGKIGAKIIVLALPAKRAVLLMKEGKIDGEMSRVKSYENILPGLIRVSEPSTQMPYFVYTKTANFKVNGWKSLIPYKVVHLRGYKIIEANLKPIHNNLHPANSMMTAFRFMLAGRADVLVDNPLNVATALRSKELKDKGIKRLMPPVAVVTTYAFFPARHAELAKKYEKALKEIKKEGTYMKILTQTK